MTTSRKKFWTLLFSGMVVLALILLSAGLPELEFSPGRPLPRSRGAEGWLFGGGEPPPGGKILETLYVAVVILAQILLPISIIYFIISPEARKQVLRSLSFLLWILALFLLIRTRPDFFRELETQPMDRLPQDEVVVPSFEFVADPPRWLVLVTALGLAVLVAAVLVSIAWFVWRRGRRPESPLERLAREAQDALGALRAGADLRNTIIRCYFEMSRVLREQRGIKREETMTTREFERHLQGVGLPGEHVQQLTRLFEGVRYGDKVPGEHEERQAITCLMAVVEACRNLP